MTVYNIANLGQWSEKVQRNLDLVVKGSIQDVGEIMTRRQPSIKETGTFEVGKVPVDTGELINSQEGSLNGGVVAAGDIDYAALVAGMELGDTVQAVFTAPHARPMEYGVSGKFPGRFFVRNAVQNWQAIVHANAALMEE
jgi:hypothetical protein